MAVNTIFKPHRGKASVMQTNAKKNMVLQSGEFFVEMPDTTSTNKFKIKVGDGSSTYENLPYAIDIDQIVIPPDTSSDVTELQAKLGSDYPASSATGFVSVNNRLSSLEQAVLTIPPDTSSDVNTLKSQLGSDYLAPGSVGFASVNSRLSSLESVVIPAEVSIYNVGTPSATEVTYQNIAIGSNNYEVAGSKYMETSVVLSSSEDSIINFTHADIHANSIVDIFTTIENMNYESLTLTEGNCSIVYAKQEEETPMSIRMYIK